MVEVDQMKHTSERLFKNVPSEFSATRYHSLIAEDLPDSIVANCMCGNEIMGIHHKKLPLFGIQFHPESCQTEYGINIIKNFIAIANT
jgi:anthranilate/para-aminobenzoate synthase component II